MLSVSPSNQLGNEGRGCAGRTLCSSRKVCASGAPGWCASRPLRRKAALNIGGLRAADVMMMEVGWGLGGKLEGKEVA